MREQDDPMTDDAIARLKGLWATQNPPKRRIRPKPNRNVSYERIDAVSDNEAIRGRLESYRHLNGPIDLSPLPQKRLLEKLQTEAPHAAEVINAVTSDLSFCTRMRSPQIPAKFILMVGPPGSGKTWVANRLASILSRGVLMQSGAGLTSAIGLLGQPATFKDADAGLAVRAIARNRIANPAIVIDEVDKTATSDWNGDPRLALLNFLEPESAQRTYDQFLQVHIDCSHVHWIFTANSLEGLPDPLLSRVQIFHIQRPGENALPAILKGFREDFAKRFGIAAGRLPQVDELLHHRLRIELNKGADLRRLRGIFESELKARATNSHRAIPHRNAN